MDQNALKLSFKYNELVTLWADFCEKHRHLYELTAAEYETLLESKIEQLESIIAEKEDVINSVYALEDTRKQLIADFANLSERKVEKIADIYPVVDEMALDSQNTLKKYNDLLLEIIDNIQDQNKKNQVFLNKAIMSLQSLKDQFKGEKSYKTYNNKGSTLRP